MADRTRRSNTTEDGARIYTLTGQPLPTVGCESKRTNARDLKKLLQQAHGLPRFRMRLLNGAEVLRDDDEIMLPAELQLLLVDYEPCDDEGTEQLVRACRNGDQLEVEWILNRPTDVNEQLWLPPCRSGREDEAFTALQAAAAAEENHMAIVELLLEAAADVHAPGNDTALWWAAGPGHSGAVQRLLQARARVDAKTRHGETALHRAAWKHREAVAEVRLPTMKPERPCSQPASRRASLWQRRCFERAPT